MAFPSAAAIAAIAGCFGRCRGACSNQGYGTLHFWRRKLLHAVSRAVQDYQGCFSFRFNGILPPCC